MTPLAAPTHAMALLQALADPALQSGPPGLTLGFLALAAGAGAVSLLTPCVFPMLPITVSYFIERSPSRPARARAIADIASFGAGIVGTFTALGVVVAAVFGAAGLARFAANAWVNLAMAAVFFLLALNLLGFLTVQVPPALLTRLDAASRRSGISRAAGAFVMGVLFSLTSFTCTAPFVGTLLVVAAGGEWRLPLAGMLVYALVFALPFVLLAVVPRWLARLPRAGAWMMALKGATGFVELAAAVKFLANADMVWGWNILTHDVVLGAWVLLALALAFYLLGAFRLPHEPPREAVRTITSSAGAIPIPGVARGSAALAALAAGMWLATGLGGTALGSLEAFLPPPGGVVPTSRLTAVPGELQWKLNDLPGALAVARQERRRVFIDFTGYTCTNCRWMERNMFTRPEIRAALGSFVLARLFTDGDGPVYERQQLLEQRQFGTIALPLYAVVDANGRTIETFAGLTRSPREFLAFLERARGN